VSPRLGGELGKNNGGQLPARQAEQY